MAIWQVGQAGKSGSSKNSWQFRHWAKMVFWLLLTCRMFYITDRVKELIKYKGNSLSLLSPLSSLRHSSHFPLSTPKSPFPVSLFLTPRLPSPPRLPRRPPSLPHKSPRRRRHRNLLRDPRLRSPPRLHRAIHLSLGRASQGTRAIRTWSSGAT